MTTQAAASVPTTPPTPRRRWWRVAVAVVGLLVLAPLGFYGYSVFATRSALEEAEAEAARDLPRWRLLEIEADRPQIPDAENSALYMMALRRKSGRFLVPAPPNYEQIFENLPPTAQLNIQQADLLRTELGKAAKSLPEVRKLKDMPHGRYPITYSDDGISTLIPHHQDTRDFAELLKHDAMLLAHEKEYDRAIESCQGILHAGRAMETDTFLIALLIRAALQNMAILTLERVLAQGEASEARLAAMQAALTYDMNHSSWQQAMRGERGMINHLFEAIRDGKVQTGWLGLMRGPSGPDPFDSVEMWLADQFPSTVLNRYPEYLSHLNRAVAVASLPIHERIPKLAQWEADCKASRNPLIRMLTPGLARTHRAECRSQAGLRSAMVALACERYRLRKKDWPATLEVLVQEKLLDAVPTDPFDNQPLRYRRTKDGVVIYSIGFDLTDNHGNINREHPEDAGVDLGFRLWNVNRRRQKPPPVVVIPE
jgi:hypothetical protein